MIYTFWNEEAKPSIALRHLKYIIIGIIVIIIGLIWPQLEIDNITDNQLLIQIIIILFGLFIILTGITLCIYRIKKQNKYLLRREEIKKSGKKVIGKVVDVKRKHHINVFWDLIVFGDAPEPLGDYLYSATIEYENPYSQKLERKKLHIIHGI